MRLDISLCLWHLDDQYRSYHRDVSHGCAENDGRPSHILLAPYWERLWIVQEFALAKNIVLFCGHESLSALDIENYCALVLGTWFGAVWHVENLLITRTNISQNGRSQSLSDILNSIKFRRLRCTDPRDLIYGLMGLIHPSDRITVDYHLRGSELLEMMLERFVRGERRVVVGVKDEFRWFNIMKLGCRLGLPNRWRIWLHSDDRNSSDVHEEELRNPEYVEQVLRALFSVLQNLRLQGVSISRWLIFELALLSKALQTDVQFRSSKRPEGTAKVVEYLNSMKIPTSLEEPLDLSACSADYRVQDLTKGIDSVERRRLIEYEILIDTLMGRSKANSD